MTRTGPTGKGFCSGGETGFNSGYKKWSFRVKEQDEGK